MKKRILLISLIVLIISIAAGGVLAVAGSDEVETTNVITTGNIRIDLIEESLKEGSSTEYEPYQAPTGKVLPGMPVSKKITVKNTGNYDAWVRVKLSPVLTPEDDSAVLDPQLIRYTGTGSTEWMSYWQYNETDGYFYYIGVLEPNAVTVPLITGINFSSLMGNDYSGANVKLYVTAEATQVRNNGNNSMEAAADSWPESTTP